MTAHNLDLHRDAIGMVDGQQSLGEHLLPVMRYLSLLTGLLALGLLGIYSISQAGLFGDPSWQIAAGVCAVGFAGIGQLAILRLTRRRPYAGYLVFSLWLGIWGLVLTYLWDSAWSVAILIAWIAPLAGIAPAVPRRRVLTAAVLSAAYTLGIVWLDAHAPAGRLSTSNPAGSASLILVASTIALFVLGTIVVRLIPYRSVQGRLVVSFILIVTVPILVTTAVSVINGRGNSQEQFGASLEAVSSLKQGQISALVHDIGLEISTLQQGSGGAAPILRVIDRSNQSEATRTQNATVATGLLRNVMLLFPASRFEEILIIDQNGNVVLSTYKPDEGANFVNEPFFGQGANKYFAQMLRFPGKQNASGEYKLVASAPFYASGAEDIVGVVVAVANGDVIFKNLGPVAGMHDAQTYLVGTNYRRLTDVAGQQNLITAGPIVLPILNRSSQASTPYVNDEGQAVLGRAAWEPSINAVVVAEVPQSEVYNKAFATLLISIVVGLFTIVTAVIAALSTSRAISEPIRTLATAAKSLSTGDLSARASSDQHDEVGNLTNSFNAMANQLQDIIGNLEQRIAERTDALEQQSLRLRTAAEVARDAANAPNLDALLEQAARLIRDRFGLYHTGIFLLDERKEYAVLRASPSAAGEKMLENRHRLRVGEQGIVGLVAATGAPRIALDTGVDSVYFSNPLLPQTRSEMALPLKTADETIGVIDIQSDQPEAFTQDDIAIVQVMADQLATAIQRSQLLQQVQAQLSQLEQSYQGFTEQSWRVFEESGRQNLGYRFDNVRLESMKAAPLSQSRLGQQDSLPTSAAASEPGEGESIEVPIQLRGQTIGIVRLRFQSGRSAEAALGMVQQITDRLATALENARLLEESMRRANKERALSDITSKISASVNMRNVLQTAVEELGRAIPGSDVLVQLRPDTES